MVGRKLLAVFYLRQYKKIVEKKLIDRPHASLLGGRGDDDDGVAAAAAPRHRVRPQAPLATGAAAATTAVVWVLDQGSGAVALRRNNGWGPGTSSRGVPGPPGPQPAAAGQLQPLPPCAAPAAPGWCPARRWACTAPSPPAAGAIVPTRRHGVHASGRPTRRWGWGAEQRRRRSRVRSAPWPSSTTPTCLPRLRRRQASVAAAVATTAERRRLRRWAARRRWRRWQLRTTC
eukprot:SAG25_NODE_3616_length_1022_cov_1.204767_1_plen_231_part_10